MNVRPNIESQRAYYDERWSRETYANHLQLQRTIAILDGLKSLQLSYQKILDLGCGTGWLTSTLGRFGPATGIDLSERAIQEAQARHPDVRFIAMDLSRAAVVTETYDVVVSQEVIEHLEDQKHYLDSVAQFLNPGGYLILNTPNAWNFEHWTPGDLTAWGLQPVENWVTRGKLKSMLQPQFKAIRLTSIISGYGSRGIFRIVNSAKLAAVLRKCGVLNWYERALKRAGFGLHIIAVAQRC